MERHTKVDGGKEMDITTVPILVSQFYKKRNLEGKNIFVNSLPMKKQILRKRFHLHPYFHNRLSGFQNDRRVTFSARRNTSDIGLNLLYILISWMNTKEANVSKQTTNDNYNLKSGPSYTFKTYLQRA